MVIVEGHGCGTINESVHVFRAKDFSNAFDRALEIGRRHETKYKNGDGNLVVWRFKEVLTLDMVRVSLDGAEVHSKLKEVEPPLDLKIDAVFHPERSKPSQTF